MSSCPASAAAVSLSNLPPRLELRPQLVRRLPQCRRTLSAQFVACAGSASEALEEAAVSFMAEGISVHALTQTMVAARAQEVLQNSRPEAKRVGDVTQTDTVGEHPGNTPRLPGVRSSPGQKNGEVESSQNAGDVLLRRTGGLTGNNRAQGPKPAGEGNKAVSKPTEALAGPYLRVKEEQAGASECQDRERRAVIAGRRSGSPSPGRETAEPRLGGSGRAEQDCVPGKGSGRVAGAEQCPNRKSEKTPKYEADPLEPTCPERQKFAGSCDRPGLQSVLQGPSSRAATLQRNTEASRVPSGTPVLRGKALVDDEHLGYLVWETVREDKSVIVFCATKSWCERSASYLERYE